MKTTCKKFFSNGAASTTAFSQAAGVASPFLRIVARVQRFTQKHTVLYGKNNPARKFQKIPGKFQKWACAAREARGARPSLGISGFF